MCQSSEEAIKIEKKTDIGKYEFLRSYYTLWNAITKVSPRVIIDTHAGPGKARYIDTSEFLYGSPLLAILKTIMISNKLTLVFNEKEKSVFETLEHTISEIRNNGIPVLEKKNEYYRKLDDGSAICLKTINKYKYPDREPISLEKGYQIKNVKTKAKIDLYNYDIEGNIGFFIDTYYSQKCSDDKSPKVLFFIDPCGSVSWNNVIAKIGECSKGKEGIEMILNFSYEAITRTKNKEEGKETICKMFGYELTKEAERLVKTCKSPQQYCDEYKNKLEQFWNYILAIPVFKYLEQKPKMSKYPSYFLIFCTNNEAGYNIVKGKFDKLLKKLSMGGENNTNIDNFF